MNKVKDKRAPLLSWDIYLSAYSQLLSDSRKNQIVSDLEVFKNKCKWDTDIHKLIDSFDFEAVIVTNSKQEIQYASEGFKKLTGYPFNFIKGKSPSFLQGENTCFETRSRIRNSIKESKPFREDVVNYRKNGDEYNCRIVVYPMRNSKSNEITHYVALEREI